MSFLFFIPFLVSVIVALGVLVSPLWPVSSDQQVSNRVLSNNRLKFCWFVVINIVCGLIASLCLWLAANSKSSFPEVWNYRITNIKHETKWTTEESRQERYQSGTDSDGNATYSYKTVYYTDTHGPYWHTIDEYGKRQSISSGEYNNWAKFWGNEVKTGDHKGSASGFGRSIDGEIFECKWPKTLDTIYPKAVINRYQNKIRVSNSVLKYGEPTEEEVGLYPRPADIGNTSPVLCYGGRGFKSDDVMTLRRFNAQYGRRKQIHTMLVVLGDKDTRSKVESILKAWQGPNKNELCTFVSLNGNEVNWIEVHSWLDNTTLHGAVRDELMSEPFSVSNYVSVLESNIPKLWHRKEFTEVNEYLEVPVSPAFLCISVLLSLILCVVSFFVIESQRL